MIEPHPMDRLRMDARFMARELGHFLGLFDPCGERAASAECIHPGCNMGVSIHLDGPVIDGAAVFYRCAGAPHKCTP